MWKIIQIFDGDYDCEELAPGAKPKVSVTLENEHGKQKTFINKDIMHLLMLRLIIGLVS